MTKYLALLATSAILFSCSEEKKSAEKEKTAEPLKPIEVTYPVTEKGDVVDDYHGTKIADPYRWLEYDTAGNVKAWVKEQNKVTFGYLEKTQGRKIFKGRLEQIFDYEKVGSPRKVGDYYFYYKNSGLQNQAVIYFKKGLDGKEEVFIDPNELDKKGTTSIGLLGSSADNKYISYSVSLAGSDWMEIHTMEIETKKELSDIIKWVKFSDATWFKDGFFYSRYPTPAPGKELSAENKFHSVYYHKLGDAQEKDKLIFEDRKNPLRYHYVQITEDEKYLILYVASGTNGFECHYKEVEATGKFTPLFTGFENKSNVIDHVDGKFYIHTDIDAPKYRLIALDPKNPKKENWTEIIPENDNLLEGVSMGGGKMFAQYLQDVTTRIYQYDLTGKLEHEIKLPGLGTAGGLGGKKEDTQMFYSFTSFTYPTTIFSYNVETGKSEVFYQPELRFNPEDFTSEQIFYTSKDGTKIPMFIVYKKGMKKTGKNPTLLYAYGGFNVSITPSFSVSIIPILEQGGIYVLANLRGGGEYGEEWHQAGMFGKKQNVFDDFIAAAEYLIDKKYTSSDYLAISGGSNGGLLVGACMTQRPELYKVAFPAVGVLDMLRFHKFTVGFGWIAEYGSSDNKEDFEYLVKYSPYHNVKEGINYPATMVLTGDHDDRVVPAHSFKFIAELQAKNGGKNPVLIRIETDAGHGAGKPTSKVIEETADKWAFMFQNMGISVK
jgi:prolyl oligopeptidase